MVKKKNLKKNSNLKNIKYRTLRSNYRPISLTSVISKIPERIIRDELLGHLFENNLVSKAQHGFVSAKSCLSNILETRIGTDTAWMRSFWTLQWHSTSSHTAD